MTKKGGYSLVETMVAMVILALIVIPTCSGLVLSHRINDKAEKLLEGQLAISEAQAYIEANGGAVDGVAEKFENISIVDGKIRYDLGDGKCLEVELEVSP